MTEQRSRRRVVLLLAVAVLAAGVGVLFSVTGALGRLELASVDARFDVRGDRAAPSDIVIVAMDDKTLKADDATFPLNRKRHAKVIEELTKAGASVIAYDVQFTEQSDDEDADNALIEAVRASPRVVLGTFDLADDGTTTIFGGGDALEYSGATPALSRIPNDTDGRNRRMIFREGKTDGFAVAAAKLDRKGKLALPAGDSAWIDYPGKPGTVRRISFSDVETGKFDPAAVRGKIVVVGATALSGQDFHETSTGREMPGPEIQAAAIDTALRGFPLAPAADWLNLLLAVLLAVIAPLAALRLGTVIALLAGMLASVVFLIAAQLAFQNGTIVDIVPPLAGAFTGLAGTLLVAAPHRSARVDRILDRITSKSGNQRTRRLRALLLLGAAFTIVSGVLVLDAGHVLRNADLSTVDQRFRVRGPQTPRNDVVVAAIDDKSVGALPAFPIPRSYYARAIRNLTKAGAAAIAMDVEFVEPSGDKKSDASLIQALHDGPPSILSSTASDGSGATKLFSFGKGLEYTGGTPAASVVKKDADGRVRRMFVDVAGLVGFGVAGAEAKLGHPIQTPPGDSAWIDYAGGAEAIPYVSFVDIEQNKFDPAQVRGKVVVVGATQTSFQDQHNTSTTREQLMPGPEIQANSIATALSGFPLHEVPWWVDVLMIIVVGVAAPFAGLRLGLYVAVGFGVAVVAIFLVAAQYLFQHHNAIVTVIYPFVAGVAGILATAAIHGLTVAFEREQARDAFARFVPEAVVDQVLADADGARLGGVRGEATVMFSDLRGFTSFSETLEPERVIESLNKYLTEMSEAILNHGGTLVAYMGDGIMAVFGAPLKQEDHADRALEAARDMLDRMEGFNAWLREQELNDGFKMGIGLNSGPVMSGNVGSERRLEYTALGDTTNTAARLEGMTKGTPHQLFISDTTKQALMRPVDDLVAVGEAEVRGRKAKVLLWSISDDEPTTPAEPAPERVEA